MRAIANEAIRLRRLANGRTYAGAQFKELRWMLRVEAVELENLDATSMRKLWSE